MEITLMCAHQSGQAAFNAEWIEGIPAPQRRYDICGGKVVLAGYSDTILHHDAEDLLKQSIFRMPTPAEQEAWTGLHKATDVPANMIQESVELTTFTTQVQRANGDGEAILTEQGDGPAPTDSDPEEPEPPAKPTKKASGG